MLFCCKQLAVFPSSDLACICQWLCQARLTWLILNWSCRTEKSVLASSGFQADIRALQKNLDARHQVCRSPVIFFSEFSCFSCVWIREEKNGSVSNLPFNSWPWIWCFIWLAVSLLRKVKSCGSQEQEVVVFRLKGAKWKGVGVRGHILDWGVVAKHADIPTSA